MTKKLERHKLGITTRAIREALQEVTQVHWRTEKSQVQDELKAISEKEDFYAASIAIYSTRPILTGLQTDSPEIAHALRPSIAVTDDTQKKSMHPMSNYYLPSLFHPLLVPLDLPVIGLDKVAHVLGLLVSVVVVTVVVVVISLGTDVLHLVDVAAFGASLDRAVTGNLHTPLAPNIHPFLRPIRFSFSRTVSQMTGWESTGKPVQPAYCSSPAERTKMGSFMVPFREASRGDMSKMSTPSIFPRISRRSIPVDCSRSVGMVPGWAPGPTRSSTVLISVVLIHRESACVPLPLLPTRRPNCHAN